MNSAGVAILDARAPNFYTGKNSNGFPRAGHIPGALNLLYTTLFDSTDRYLPLDSLEARFRAAGIKPNDDVICMMDRLKIGATGKICRSFLRRGRIQSRNRTMGHHSVCSWRPHHHQGTHVCGTGTNNISVISLSPSFPKIPRLPSHPLIVHHRSFPHLVQKLV